MPRHVCIGPVTIHTKVTSYSDGPLLNMYREHREPGWYEESLREGRCKSPQSLRRWMRMVTQEVHRRGLTP